METKITVIIPSQRRTQLLNRCLNALNRQSLEKHLFEVLVVSDGPDDKTARLVLSYKSYNFKYFCLPGKQGSAAARNLGWKNAAGRLLVFTEEDTIPQPNWLESYLEADTGELMAAYAGTIKVPVSEDPTDYERTMAQLEDEGLLMANCALSVAAMEATGGFDERFYMTWGEDHDLEFKLLQQQIPVYTVPDALVVHPPGKGRWGISISQQRKRMFDVLLYKKHPAFYRQRIQAQPAWNNYLIVASLLIGLAAAIYNFWWVVLASFACYVVAMISLVLKRLLFTSRASSHVWEVIATSFVIPFASAYWQLYGAYRYRAFYL